MTTAALPAPRLDGLHVDAVSSPYSTSYPLYHATLTRRAGAPVELMLKDLAWASMLPAARRTKPHFLYDPDREIGVYRDLLDPDVLGTARCYATGDGASGSAGSWLLVERVPAVRLVEVGDLEPWLRAFRWLARLHALDGVAPLADHSVPLVQHNEHFYRRWMTRARRSVRDERLRWVAAHYDAVVARLLAQPSTFIHGELYASNVLVSGDRVCAIDWEMAGIGPALVDVAALSSGAGWSEADRGSMLRAYRNGADVDGDFLADLDACAVYLAIQWLGWSAAWTPPSELAHDWLAVAVAATERLVGRS